VKQRRKSTKANRPAFLLLGISAAAASVLAAAPASAARTTGSPREGNLIAALHPRPGLLIRPGPRGLLDPFAMTPAAVSRSGELTSVFCPSASDCWAVGDDATKVADLNEVLHWTGKKWFQVKVPEPGGTGQDDVNQLLAVRCTSAKDCWAVGNYKKAGAELDQILHWTGKKWFVVSAPTPAGTLPGDQNVLFDVACTSAASCWAGGDYGTGDSAVVGEILKNQALHWNGTSWSLVKTPNPAGSKKNDGNAISSIRCASPTDCWAAGSYGVLGKKFILHNEMLHWTGRKWTQVTVPDLLGTKVKGTFNELLGLSCTSAGNCLAVGEALRLAAHGKGLNAVLRWNGAKWRKVAVPNPDGSGPGSVNSLVGVTCAGASDCWAVGSYGGLGTGVQRNEALHWTGKGWKAVSTPNPGGSGKQDVSALAGVRCPAPANCWAVGSVQHGNGPSRDEVLHWNGTKWVVG
jgi:hypothetical protein